MAEYYLSFEDSYKELEATGFGGKDLVSGSPDTTFELLIHGYDDSQYFYLDPAEAKALGELLLRWSSEALG